jgi:hypothetical protein
MDFPMDQIDSVVSVNACCCIDTNIKTIKKNDSKGKTDDKNKVYFISKYYFL